MGTVAAAETGGAAGWLRRILIGRNPKFTLIRILVWIVVIVFLSKYAFLPVRIDGPSMLPTYRERGVNIINRLAYLFHPPQRGDVVGIKLAGEHVMYLKRIVGLPGETLRFHQGHLMIDDRVVDEPYLKFPCNWETAPVKISEGQYYVVGDNRSMEFQDHVQGRALKTRIVGKALL